MGTRSESYRRTRRRGAGGLGASKKGAPLRKVVTVLRPQDNIFDKALVKLECGHQVRCWGGVRARCVQCKKEADEQEQLRQQMH
jgi:hypothetical protein